MRLITLIIILLSCSTLSAADSTNCYTLANEANKTPSFGQLYEQNELGSETALTLTTKNQWYYWDSAHPLSRSISSAYPNTVTTSTGVGSSISIGDVGGGRYFCCFLATISGPQNAIIELTLAIDGVPELDIRQQALLKATGEREHMPNYGLVECENNKVARLAFRCISGNAVTINIHNISFTAFRLGRML